MYFIRAIYGLLLKETDAEGATKWKPNSQWTDIACNSDKPIHKQNKYYLHMISLVTNSLIYGRP